MVEYMRKLVRKKDVIEKMKAEPVKKKILYKYKKKRCDHVNADGKRCEMQTAGKGNFCCLHAEHVFREDTNPIVTLNTNNVLLIKYDPINHPVRYIELASQGMNQAEIAAEFKVSLETLNSWRDTYPMFNVAFDVGKAAHEAWYLRTGKDNLDNRWFQTPLFKFLAMNNGLGWSDKAETKSTQQGSYGVLLIPGQMSIDEWEQKNIEEDEKIKEIFDTNAEVHNE